MSRPKRARVFSRTFKLAAVRRMMAGESVIALSRELRVLRKDLYLWYARFRGGGADALRAEDGHARPWRCRRQRGSRQGTWTRRASRLPNWSARSASNSWIWIFF